MHKPAGARAGLASPQGNNGFVASMSLQSALHRGQESEDARVATIMVVEDEPAIQELIACILEHAGHVPLRADSAERALELIRGTLLDLMLVDWMLPGASGMELTRRLRADRRTGDLPIIMLTARSEERDKLAGIEIGADDYVTKPHRGCSHSPLASGARAERT